MAYVNFVGCTEKQSRAAAGILPGGHVGFAEMRGPDSMTLLGN